MFDKYICPECSGSGVWFPEGDDGYNAETCFYCNGLGLASEEDMEEHFHYYDD